jgi:hypothetical protein
MKKLLEEHLVTHEAEEFIHEKIKDTVVMVGEARVFYLDVPVVASTVFDRNLLEILFTRFQNMSSIAEFLKKQNLRYLYIHWNEISRLRDTYTFKYDKETIPGFLWLDIRKLHYFLDKHCQKIFPEKASKTSDKIEIYFVK